MIDVGDLISLDGSVYGAQAGVVTELLPLGEVRIVYTAEDGSINRIRRRAESIVVVRKQNENE